MHQKDLALTLRSLTYGERDRIVTAITEHHGLVTALARNSIQSRRFGGSLDPFTASEWQFSFKPGADLASLTEASVRHGFEPIRGDFDRLTLASLFAEILLKLIQPGQPVPELFKLYGNALSAIEEWGASFALLNAFMSKILQWSGQQPQWQACAVCSKSLQDVLKENSETELRIRLGEPSWVCAGVHASQTGRPIRELGISLPARVVADALLFTVSPIRKSQESLIGSPAEHEALASALKELLVFHVPGFDRMELKSWALFRPVAS